MHILSAIIFTSAAVYSYPRAVLTNDFKEVGRDWSLDPLPAILDGKNWTSVHNLYAEMDNFTRLGTNDCIEAYIDPFASSGQLVVIAANVTPSQNDNHTLLHGWDSGWDVWSRAPWWICEAYNIADSSLLCTSQ